jgi:peptide deformylase
MQINNTYLLSKIEPIPEGQSLDKDLANRMMQYMHRKKAIGLAANQIGYNYRLFVMDVVVPRRCFNPEILDTFSPIENISYNEGCLSYPGQFIVKSRYGKILVGYTNQNGIRVEEKIQGLEAICFQHELDHLEGKQWNQS